MAMSRQTFLRELEANRLTYDRMRDQIARDFAGKYVALAFGRIVVDSTDFEKVLSRIKQLDPAPAHVVVFAADKAADPNDLMAYLSLEEIQAQIRFEDELEENRAAYEGLKAEIRSKYAEKYVALAFGRIITAVPDYREACAAVDNLQPAPHHSAVFRGDQEPAFEPYEDYYREYL
jgi:hypothetical protein